MYIMLPLMTLGCFINLYEKMAYANHGEFIEISTY